MVRGDFSKYQLLLEFRPTPKGVFSVINYGHLLRKALIPFKFIFVPFGFEYYKSALASGHFDI